MPQYKLMYFNSRGLAECARIMLTLAGQEFEDYRFKEGEWPGELKGNTKLFPLGQAPVLLIDGKPLHESGAIVRYVAREFGFYGSNNSEKAEIDVIYETVDDILLKFLAVYQEKDETKKAALLVKYREEDAKPFLTYLNALIKDAGGRFFIGDKISLADISVYGLIDFFYSEAIRGRNHLNENYQDLAKFHKEITEDSELSEYIKSRPKTVF